MTTQQISVPETFEAKVRGVSFNVEPVSLPVHSLERIFAYGLQRILNDACAGAKNDEEAKSLAETKWGNLKAGVLRASGTREGDPIKAEAKRIALAKVLSAPVFKGWLAENSLKAGDKDAKAKAGEMAVKLAQREDILAQARANVVGVKDLEIEIEL